MFPDPISCADKLVPVAVALTLCKVCVELAGCIILSKLSGPFPSGASNVYELLLLSSPPVMLFVNVTWYDKEFGGGG